MNGLLDSEHIRALADEETVRGVLVRKFLEEAEGAEIEDLRTLEKALQLLLGRFQSMEAGDS